jgi:hypothetical protein
MGENDVAVLGKQLARIEEWLGRLTTCVRGPIEDAHQGGLVGDVAQLKRQNEAILQELQGVNTRLDNLGNRVGATEDWQRRHEVPVIDGATGIGVRAAGKWGAVAAILTTLGGAVAALVEWIRRYW